MIPLLWGAARAEVTFESPPEAGAETVVVLERDGEPVGGATVRVVTRPGLAGSREIAVGITDGRGRVKWAPETAGLTLVRAGDESVRVLVARPEAPRTPVLLLAVLGVAALGLLAVGAWRRRP